MNKISISGFTLAEILITLAIVGVLVAITIPALINNIHKMENVTALKKTYETLSNVYLLISAENGGSMITALSRLDSDTDHEGFSNVFISKMNVAKNCGIKETKDTGCYPMYSGNANWSTIVTNDRIVYVFRLTNKNCTDANASCGVIIVDVNGAKGSSSLATERFEFYVTAQGLYPSGYEKTSDYLNSLSCPASQSTYCTVKVLSSGKIDN